MIELYPYQRDYLRGLPSRVIMDAELGTGKTLMSIAHYEAHAKGQPLLIIAPASKTRGGDWEDELEAYYGNDLPEYRIISRERFSTGKNGGKPMWWDFVPKFGGKQYAVIVDEIHIGGRNPSSSFHRKLMYATKDADFFVGLSGTPLPNGWSDFIGYALLYGITSTQTDFKRRYFDIVRYKGYPEIVGYKHEDEMAQYWQDISKHLSRANAHELPDQQFMGLDFDKPWEYTKMAKEQKDGEELLDTPSKLLHHLRQTLTIGKIDRLRSILDDTSENVVLFYNYNSEREAIKTMLEKHFSDKTVYELNGHEHNAPSKSEWVKVGNSVTLCQYKSASAGVELTYATITVYFSPTYSWADYKQSIGRTHRNGQTKKCIYYNFRTKDTVEVDVYKCLKNKEDFKPDNYIVK